MYVCMHVCMFIYIYIYILYPHTLNDKDRVSLLYGAHQHVRVHGNAITAANIFEDLCRSDIEQISEEGERERT